MNNVNVMPTPFREATYSGKPALNKKKYIFFIFLVCLMFLSVNSLKAQWKRINLGPTGWEVHAVTAMGSYVLAGTIAGINRSTDYGADWASVTSSITLCFASIDSIIIAGTDAGVILSSDMGAAWIMPDTSMRYYITSLAVKDTIIFAGTLQNGIFRSTNFGTSWTAVDSGLGDFQNLVEAIAVKGDTIFAGTHSGLCFSTNNGNKWTTVSGDALNSLQFINCIASYNSFIFVGTPGGMFRSTDNGYSWETDNNGISFGASIFSIFVTDSDVFIGTTERVYKSTDNGASWTKSDSGLPVYPKQVFSIASGPNKTGGTNLYAATDNGVYLSIDNGANWEAENKGTVDNEVRSITGLGPKVFAVINGSPIFFSTDYGTTWRAAKDSGLVTKVNPNLTATSYGLYAATSDSGIFVSSDNGDNWKSINGGVMDTLHPLDIVQSGPNLIVSTNNNGIFLSSDNGTNWKIASNNMPKSVSALSIVDSNIFAVFEYGMYRSTDNGENWIKVNNFYYTGYFNGQTGIVSADGVLFLSNGHAGIVDTTGGYFRSTDNGKTWIIDRNWSIKYGGSAFSLFAYASDIFTAPWTYLYVSTNNGDSWNKLGGDLESIISSVYVNDSSVFVGNFQGIWQMPLKDIVSSVKQPALQTSPGSFKLWQNYPNPFNPSTTIMYDIPKLSQVIISIYDILGRKIKTLVNAQMVPGHYRVNFNASDLASGVYFYRLTAGSFVQTKKLLLIK